MAAQSPARERWRWSAFAPLITYLDTRVARWIRRRQGEDQLPVTLGRRRLYILPTRAGIAFGALLLLMLLAGLNYANSLALFLTFLLAAFALFALAFAAIAFVVISLYMLQKSWEIAVARVADSNHPLVNFARRGVGTVEEIVRRPLRRPGAVTARSI